MHFIVVKGGANRYAEIQKNSSKFHAKLNRTFYRGLLTDISFLRREIYIKFMYDRSRWSTNLFINKLLYVISASISFLLLQARKPL